MYNEVRRTVQECILYDMSKHLKERPRIIK